MKYVIFPCDGPPPYYELAFSLGSPMPAPPGLRGLPLQAHLQATAAAAATGRELEGTTGE